MDRIDVSQLTDAQLQALTYDLPRLCRNIGDEQLHDAIASDNLQAVVDRLQDMVQQTTQEQRFDALRSSRTFDLDAIKAPVVWEFIQHVMKYS